MWWKIVEAIASACGLISVVLGIYKYVWVYPVGMVSTIAYIFIMLNAQLYGDALVNVIYTIVSAYGWYQWSNTAEDGKITARSATLREKFIALGGFAIGSLIIYLVYKIANEPTNWLDILSSSLFAVAMWLMAEQCVESWNLWFIGDLLAVCKVEKQKLYFTGAQYLVLTIMALWGWYEWWCDLSDAHKSDSDEQQLSPQESV